MSECGCDCVCAPTLLYACSGAADVGEIADRTARMLSAEGYGKMSCLAGVGAGLSGFVESAKAAKNITIDGCPMVCAKKTFENQGIAVRSFVLTDMGLVKGSTSVAGDVIRRMSDAIQKIMMGSTADASQ